MKHIGKIVAVMAIVALPSSLLSAQSRNMGYFLDGYAYAFKLNPAIQDSVSFTGLGVCDMNLGVASNLGVNDLIYKRDGKFVTGLHPDVSSAEFLGNIGRKNLISGDVDISIVSRSIKPKKTPSYHVIDISLRQNVGISVPYDFFRMIKDGSTNGSTFNMNNLACSSMGFLQASYGYSRKFWGMFTFGIRAKALLGIDYIRLNYDRAMLTADKDAWRLETHGSFKYSLGKTEYETKASELYPDKQVIDMESLYVNSFAPSGYGAAIDLGIQVEPIPGLIFSAAVLDLGGIMWKNCIAGSTSDNLISYEPVDDIDLNSKEGSNSITDQFDGISEKASAIAEFYPEDGISDFLTRLAFTVNAGVEYKMPFYRKLSVAALGTWKNDSMNNIMEGRAFVNWTAAKWLSFSASCATGTYGFSYGAMTSVHWRAFKFHLGVDTAVYKFSPQYIPVGRPTTNIILGIGL